MHPLLQDIARGLAQSGARAFVQAVDSVLEDVEGIVEEANARVKRARSRVKKKPTKRGKSTP